MWKIICATFIVIIVLLIPTTSGCSTNEKTLSPAEFYKDKTVNMVIGTDPGSFNDLIGRVIANRLGKDIQGNVLVENRREAGGLESMNYLARASTDGLTVGVISPVKFLSNKILNDPAAVYKFEDFSYTLKVDSQQAYFVVSSSGPYKSVDALKAGVNLKIAAGTASGFNSLAGLTVIDILKLDGKVVTGFENNSARSLATQRGEVVGYANNISGIKAELAAGTLTPLFVIATQRDPVRPDIPAITELIKLPEDDLSLLRLWETDLASGTLLLTPAGVPEDKLKFLNSLADVWSKDVSFCQEIDQVSGYKVLQYTGGSILNKSIKDTAAALEKFQTRFAEMIKKYRL